MKSKAQILLIGHSWVRHFIEFKDVAAENGFIFESNWWPNANLETIIQNIERFKLIKHYHRNLLVFCIISETWRYETLENVEPIYDNAGVPINPYEILMPNPDFDISKFIEKFTKFREQFLTIFPKLNILLMSPPRIDVYQYNLKLISNFPPMYQKIFLTNPKYSLSQMAEYSRNIYAKILEICNYSHGWPEKSIFRNQICAQKVKQCRKIFTKYMKQEVDTCGEAGPLVDGLNPTKDLIELFWKQINSWLVLDQELCDNPLLTYFPPRNPYPLRRSAPKADRYPKSNQISSHNLVSYVEDTLLNSEPFQVLLVGDSWAKYVADEQNVATKIGFQLDSQWWIDANLNIIMQNIDKYLKPCHKFLMVSCITSEAWQYETLEDFTSSDTNYALQLNESNYIGAGFQPNANQVLMPNVNFSISDFVNKFNQLRYYCSKISSETHVMLLIPTIIDAYQFNVELISKYPESQQEIFHKNPKYGASVMAEYAKKLHDKLSLMCCRWPASCFFRNQILAERIEFSDIKSTFIRFRKGKLDTCGKVSPLVDGINPTIDVIKLFWEQIKFWYRTSEEINFVMEPLHDGQASRVLMIGDDSVKCLNIGMQSSISQLAVNFLSQGNIEQLIKLANTYLSLEVDVLFIAPFNWEFLYLANYIPYEEEPKVPLINESIEINRIIEVVKNSTEIWKQSYPECKVIWALPHPIDFQSHYQWKVTEYGMGWNPTPEMNYNILYMTKAFYSLILQLEKEWKQSIPEINYIDLRQCFFAEEPNLEYTFCDNNQPVFPSKILSKNGIDPSESLAQWFKMALLDKIEEMEKAAHIILLREKRRKHRILQNYKRYLKKNEDKTCQDEIERQNAESVDVHGDLEAVENENVKLDEISMDGMDTNVKGDSSTVKTSDEVTQDSNLQNPALQFKLAKKEKKKRKKMRQKERLRLAYSAENPFLANEAEPKAPVKPEVYLIYPDGESHLLEKQPNLPKLMDLPLAPPGYMTSLSVEQDLLVTGSMLEILGETLPYLRTKPIDSKLNDKGLINEEISVFTKLAKEEFFEVSPFRILDISQSSYSHKYSLFFQRSRWKDLFLKGGKEAAMDAILSAIKSMLMLKCEKGVKIVMITTSLSFISEVKEYLKPLVDKNFIGINDDITLGSPVVLVNTPSNLTLLFSQPNLWDLSDVCAIIMYGDDMINRLPSPMTNELTSLIKLIYDNVYYEHVNKVVISESGAREYEQVAGQILRTRFTAILEMECPPPKDESLSLFELLAAEIEKVKCAEAEEELRIQRLNKKKNNQKKKYSNFYTKNKLSKLTTDDNDNMEMRADASASIQKIIPFDPKLDSSNLSDAEAEEFSSFLKNLVPKIKKEYFQASQKLVIAHEKQYQNFVEVPIYHLQYEKERSKFIEDYKLKFGLKSNDLEMEIALTEYWKKYIANLEASELKNKIRRLQEEFKSKYTPPTISSVSIDNDTFVKEVNSNNITENAGLNISNSEYIISENVSNNFSEKVNRFVNSNSNNVQVVKDSAKLITLQNNVNEAFGRIFNSQGENDKQPVKNYGKNSPEIVFTKVCNENEENTISQISKINESLQGKLPDMNLTPIANKEWETELGESNTSIVDILASESVVNKEIIPTKPNAIKFGYTSKANPVVGKVKFTLSSKENSIQSHDISKNAYQLQKNRNKTTSHMSEKNLSPTQFLTSNSEKFPLNNEMKYESPYSESAIKRLLLKEYPKRPQGPKCIASSEPYSTGVQPFLVPVSDLLKSSEKKPSFGELLKMLGTSDRIEELIDVMSGQTLAGLNDTPFASSNISHASDKKRSHSLNKEEKIVLESNPGMQEYLRESRQMALSKNRPEQRPNDSSKKLKLDSNYMETRSQSSVTDKFGYSKESERKLFKIEDGRNQNAHPIPVAHSMQKEKYLDSLETALYLLEPICDFLGLMGPSLKLVLTQAKTCLPNYNQAFKIFAEEESISLVNFAINKMKSLSFGSDANKYDLEIQQASVLLQLAKTFNHSAHTNIVCNSEPIKTSPNYPVDVESIAKATSGKDSMYIYQFIRNTYVYKGLPEPSAKELGEVFKAVYQIHFTVAFD